MMSLRARLILALHAGARRCLARGRVGQARVILAELDGALDLARGGIAAATLRRIYRHLDHQMARGGPTALAEADRMLKTLEEAWGGWHMAHMAQTGGGPGLPAPHPPPCPAWATG